MRKKSFSRRRNPFYQLIPWLGILAMLTWAILLLKYAITGQYKLLIHPNYFLLMLASSICLLLLVFFRGLSLINSPKNPSEKNDHITLFPPGFGSILLLTVAIAGLIIPPNVLTSATALQRGVTETLPATHAQPQAFITNTKPEERSLIDWVRTLNAYPEPDAYQGLPANITGFVVELPELPDNYFLLSRFIITCCAIDASPIGIPVQLDAIQERYPPDTWLEVTGKMKTATVAIRDRTDQIRERRQLVVAATSIKTIPTPPDPYAY
ncbi:TIGR03943 family protein [Xenococcus sp. PCC 7305]|uniref:TIGR03943 family putative permease subunit n=1 Tax=Xenococcus sp. PCC 7305 TaxID=102125 RepID=UPI0002AC2FB3|nr:TIGR03943 family protein [Xenococcus sp. PCC 7305]ELS04851.1 TIGR03943 family protein [Xenococcus sp. PCC 7305]